MLTNIYILDETWLQLDSYMNRPEKPCSFENLHDYHETPVWVKTGMWHVVSWHRVIGLISSEKTVNVEHYHILMQLAMLKVD